MSVTLSDKAKETPEATGLSIPKFDTNTIIVVAVVVVLIIIIVAVLWKIK